MSTLESEDSPDDGPRELPLSSSTGIESRVSTVLSCKAISTPAHEVNSSERSFSLYLMLFSINCRAVSSDRY
jgi:hypothetical protein